MIHILRAGYTMCGYEWSRLAFTQAKWIGFNDPELEKEIKKHELHFCDRCVRENNRDEYKTQKQKD